MGMPKFCLHVKYTVRTLQELYKNLTSILQEMIKFVLYIEYTMKTY
jgi:hypothetical protein